MKANSTAGLLRTIDDEIAKHEQAKKGIMSAAKDEVRARDGLIRRLRAGRRILSGVSGPGSRNGSVTTSSTIRKAGRENIEKVRKFLAKQSEPVRQADIARGIGINSGNVSHAIKALQDEGRIEKDGRKVSYVQPGRTVKRPGE